MGLDGVDIVMAVEERFEIVVENSEAEIIATPRDLIDLVFKKVGRNGRAVCLTQRAFHRLRSSFRERGNVKRADVRPKTRLEKLFPRKTRKQQVQEILNSIGSNEVLPFVRPRWLTHSIATAAFLGMLSVIGYLNWHPVSSHSVAINFLFGSPLVGACVFTVVFCWLAVVSTSWMRTEFEPSMVDVGRFCRWIVAHSPQVVQAPPGQWSREQIAEIVRLIVMDTLGCEKNYREDAHFVKDLGLS